MNDIEFAKNLVKGRIAETLFEQMLRKTDYFTLLSFGYEKTLPELTNRQHDISDEETMKILRHAPDFAVIDNRTHEVHLIEVKYRHTYSTSDNLHVATELYKVWKPAYLFLATPEKFYLDSAKNITKNDGHMEQLGHDTIPQETQDEYLGVLNGFVGVG